MPHKYSVKTLPRVIILSTLHSLGLHLIRFHWQCGTLLSHSGNSLSHQTYDLSVILLWIIPTWSWKIEFFSKLMRKDRTCIREHQLETFIQVIGVNTDTVACQLENIIYYWTDNPVSKTNTVACQLENIINYWTDNPVSKTSCALLQRHRV